MLLQTSEGLDNLIETLLYYCFLGDRNEVYYKNLIKKDTSYIMKLLYYKLIENKHSSYYKLAVFMCKLLG